MSAFLYYSTFDDLHVEKTNFGELNYSSYRKTVKCILLTKTNPTDICRNSQQLCLVICLNVLKHYLQTKNEKCSF